MNWIVLLSLIGALDSAYTALQQQNNKLFQFCFSRLKRVDCYEILHTDYARIFGFPNSWLGIFAYTLLAIIFSATTFYLLGALIATAGLVLSLYLLHIQARVLKTYCIFCLISTSLITVITVMAWMMV